MEDFANPRIPVSIVGRTLREIDLGIEEDGPLDDVARSQALRLILTRFSTSANYLREPAPSEEDVWAVVAASLRGPDHGKRIPFRFVLSRDEGLDKLAALFVDYGRRTGKSVEELAEEQLKATQAPVVLGVIARIDTSVGAPAAHEQWAAVGGAIALALSAFHVLGFGAKMVSGARTKDPEIVKAYCKPGEVLVGWISAGTPTIRTRERGQVDPATLLSLL
jgi:nitroreductase